MKSFNTQQTAASLSLSVVGRTYESAAAQQVGLLCSETFPEKSRDWATQITWLAYTQLSFLLYAAVPPEGWLSHAKDTISASRFFLIVCTENHIALENRPPTYRRMEMYLIQTHTPHPRLISPDVLFFSGCFKYLFLLLWVQLDSVIFGWCFFPSFLFSLTLSRTTFFAPVENLHFSSIDFFPSTTFNPLLVPQVQLTLAPRNLASRSSCFRGSTAWNVWSILIAVPVMTMDDISIRI